MSMLKLAAAALMIFAPCDIYINTDAVPDTAMTAQCPAPQGRIFPRGVVPDAGAAGAVAVQILDAVYGEKVTATEVPLKVEAFPDRYVIHGVLPKNHIGGVATMVMCKSNGAVVYLSHSK
jgi:hypothetical protein